MITFTYSEIIAIVLTILRIFFYLVVIIMLYRLKAQKGITLADLLNKSVEGFKKYIGTLDPTKLISLIIDHKQEKSTDESEDKKDNG